MLQSISAFSKYFESIRRRTLNYAHAIPPDAIEWQPQSNEFTCGEILRHLAAAQHMYVGVVVDGEWTYGGHERGNLTTLEGHFDHMGIMHRAAMEKLSTANDDILMQPRPSVVPEARPVKAWRWLMAMVEHEVHHRSQLATYLTLMGVAPPQIYGVKIEEIISFVGD